jgi:uroporphyrinogen-III decarboxylase
VFGIPEVAEMLETLIKAGSEGLKMITKAREFTREMEELGFPPMFGGTAYAPFDYLGDNFRGTRGIMLDMYRNPEELLQALEKILAIVADSTIDTARRSGTPYIFMPLHKGLDGFMSLDQFKTFFWPTLRELMIRFIDAGLIPCPLWEGDCTSRLETIKDIPKGKAIYHFERTDLLKAKEVLGDTVCLRGNVSPSLLNIGTPQEVADYCKKLIDVVGKGGGFIMDGAIGVPDEAKPENVRAMVETTKTHGIY